MGKTKKYKIILTLILVMAFAMILVIGVTPLLYHVHPWIWQDAHKDSFADETPSSKTLYSDTIIMRKDTLITHRENGVSLSVNSLPATTDNPTIGDLGTFGDSAGFFNAIFSALALGAVIYTLWFQITKDDKEEERNLMNQFRDHCFTLMTMLSEIVAQLKITINEVPNISFSYSDVSSGIYGNNKGPQVTPMSSSNPPHFAKIEITGRACFKFIYEEKPNSQNVKEWIAINVGPFNTAEMKEENYQSLRKVVGDTFDHYFRTLYRILLFIKESKMYGVSIENQKQIREHCADMLRAQLSTYEMALLYYNALYPPFRYTSKVLYEEFGIFDNLEPDILCLKSESEYYKKCRKDGRDGANYKPEIHYKYTAFKSEKKLKDNGDTGIDNAAVSNTSTTSTPSSRMFKDWGNIGKVCGTLSFSWLKSKINLNGGNNQNMIDSLSDDENKVYAYIKKHQGKAMTKSKIAQDCGLSKGYAERILHDLEDGYRIITTRVASNGKIYHLK